MSVVSSQEHSKSVPEVREEYETVKELGMRETVSLDLLLWLR